MSRRTNADLIIPIAGGSVLAALAVLTGIISYQHGLEVVHDSGTIGWVAYLVPFVPDLLIAASSLAILYAAQDGVRWPPLPWCGLAFGILATGCMNVAAGLDHGRAGVLVSALAPAALLLSYETLMDMIRRARKKATEAATGMAVERIELCPHRPVPGGMDSAVQYYLCARDCLGEDPTFSAVAAARGVNRNELSALVKEHDKPAAVKPAERPQPEPAQHTPNGRVHAAATGPEGA
jgi:hypothetical protein